MLDKKRQIEAELKRNTDHVQETLNTTFSTFFMFSTSSALD